MSAPSSIPNMPRSLQEQLRNAAILFEDAADIIDELEGAVDSLQAKNEEQKSYIGRLESELESELAKGAP